MKIINLRDIYPHYTQDCFVEVTDEVADLFSEFDRKEAAYRLRTYRHKAYYSLDRNDGIEHEALFVALANVNHFFTLPGKQFFTSLFLPVGKGQGASAGTIPRGKSNTWHGAGSDPALQW